MGIPIKKSSNGKIGGAPGRQEERKDGSLSSIFPLPIVPRALSFSFSPASLRHKEASTEERAQAPPLISHRVLYSSCV